MSAVIDESVRTHLRSVASGNQNRGFALKELRKLQGKTLLESGAVVGRSDSSVVQWEKGQRWPEDPELLKRYVLGLGIEAGLVGEMFKEYAVGGADGAIALSSTDLKGSLESLVNSHTGADDIHTLTGKMFQLGMPRVTAAMLLKGSTGEVAAARLAGEWYGEWKVADASREVGTATDVTPKATAWTQQALAPSPPTDEALPAVVDKEEENGTDQ